MAKDEERRGQLALEFHCADEQVKAASFTPTPFGEGGLFSCLVGPLGDELIAALDGAAQQHRPVLLMFEKRTLLLDVVTLERKDPHSVRIVGHPLKSVSRESA